MWFLYGGLIVVAIIAFFRVLTEVSRFFNRLGAEEVANIIERHINGIDGSWDWDDFVSVPIHDRDLDAIRLRCLQLDDQPVFDRNPELKRIVEQLRTGR